jgi:hypothetical protein
MQGTTYWNGTLWGSNAGALLVEFDRKGNILAGKFALLEPGLGTTRANINGQWSDDDRIVATLSQFTAETNVPVELPKDGQFVANFDLKTSSIHGEWRTASGTQGSFVLVVGTRVDTQFAVPTRDLALSSPNVTETPSGPLVSTTLNLGSVRLDKDGLTNLVEIITSGTAIENPAINATHRGREYIHIGIASLLKEAALPGYVDTIIIAVNEPISKVGTKTIVVRLVKDGQNTVFVSGYDRIWVEGKAQQIELLVGNYKNKIISFWRNHGGNANAIVFLVLLAILPSVPLIANRLKITVATYAMLVASRLTWTKAANTRVFLHDALVPVHIKYAEYIVTTLAIIGSGLVALLIQRYVHPH